MLDEQANETQRDTLVNLFYDRRAQTIALVLLGSGLLVFLIQTYGKAYREVGFDLTSYLESARALVHGTNPYQTGSAFPYVYPMLLAFVLIPLTYLPYWLSVTVWYFVSVFSLVYSVRIVVDLMRASLRIEWGPHLYVPLVSIGMILTPVIQNNLLNGQVNFLVLLLCVVFLKSYIKNHWLVASVFLALAISIKLVPIILLLFLAVQRDFRIIGLTLLLTTAFCLLPGFLLGGQTWNIHWNYFQSTILGAVNSPGKETPDAMFFTLNGFVSYLIPSVAGATWIQTACVLTVLITTVGLDTFSRRQLKTTPGIWIFALYLLAILLILPVSETHHLTFLFPAVYLVTLSSIFNKAIPTSRSLTIVGIFCLLFFFGRVDKSGPFTFLAIVFLFAATVWSMAFEKKCYLKSDQVAFCLLKRRGL